jgi:energy-coupling factor transporter ATP-binding protein EcfA2
VTNGLKFSIYFSKFSDKPVDISFPPGLHLIYGESGSGKSQLINQILHEHDESRSVDTINFQIYNKQIPKPLQMVQQNPDDQIVGNTIENELLFTPECQIYDPSQIQEIYFNQRSVALFVDDFSRHPVSLSGGEKELLNIITATSLRYGVILIDDGLSFLANDTKRNVINYLQQYIKTHSSIILWFSSDINDLYYTDSTWELTLSSFSRLESKSKVEFPEKKFTKGSLDISIKNLQFGYSKDKLVIKNLNVDLNGVQCLGIRGTNGSGKSTLAALILGLESPNNGEIQLKLDTINSPRIGYLDQFPERLTSARPLSVLVDQLLEQGLLKKHRVNSFIQVLFKNQINWNLVKEVLPLDISWTTLRLTLLVILSHCEYDILVLDEPTFGLGWKQKVNLYSYLQQLLKHKVLIIVSHDDQLINGICDQVIALGQSMSEQPIKLSIG